MIYCRCSEAVLAYDQCLTILVADGNDRHARNSVPSANAAGVPLPFFQFAFVLLSSFLLEFISWDNTFKFSSLDSWLMDLCLRISFDAKCSCRHFTG